MISGANNGAGCLAGIARGNCTILNCTLLEGNYKCTLSGDGNADFLAFGGLVGTSDASTTFTGCTSKGNLSFEIGSSKTAVAGGIIGCCYDFDTQLALCINVGMVSGENDPHNGAICGMGYSGGPFSYEGGVCYRCIWTGDMPICYSQTDSDNVNINENYIDSKDVNNLVSGIGSDHSGWTTSEWVSKAAKWKGAWGVKENDPLTLDLDF